MSTESRAEPSMSPNYPFGQGGPPRRAQGAIGALLAGGLGRRLGGGGKAAIELAGRPLVAYPAAALGAACERVVVVCKRDTALPPLAGVERWEEPDEPRHPLTGIAHALQRAGVPVLVCAADMPFVTAEACEALLAAARASPEGAAGPTAVVAASGGRIQPVLGVYRPESLARLLAAPLDAPLTATVAALAPLVVELPHRVTRSVNTAADLAAAERELAATSEG